ncbi:MAG TPA: UDP-N-acetylglucosamine--N-acetylmuramyl-(pentapeptide) pyrophosphoryl-undecaprenol N-acetylglucosamine transferase [Acidimicrobiales bacterium]|nr:UDP-N-acetylglucosamine--N-acetylmuramyl-(pentapeptide) pyrophosphoryl-undecaprenol N-acetylglucosamine transferase [Acidimicrobiales bacterium]
MTHIVVAAGGTGGHIYPGLATAHAIKELDPSARVTFVGTPRGLEQRLITDFPLVMVDMVPWRGGRYAPQFLAATVRATFQALRRIRPDAVVAMGGYPSLPAVIAARLRGIPVVIHESGATAGRANRLAARFTKNVAVSFASATFPGRSPRVTGMPLAPANLTGNADAYPKPMVFVTGGSQGSVRLNELAVGLAARWAGRDVHIVLKTGRDHHVESTGVLQAYDYLDSIGDAYASADVVITRAGASTVAELAVWGLPSVLVPYPYALDNDQDYNAAVLADVGGAVVVKDADATADVVGPLIEGWLADPDKLAAMGARARTVGHADAAKALAEWVLDLASR